MYNTMLGLEETWTQRVIDRTGWKGMVVVAFGSRVRCGSVPVS